MRLLVASTTIGWLLPVIFLARADANPPPQTGQHRFQPFCNFPCDGSDCPDPVEFDFAPCSQTQTGTFNCTLEGCKGWTQGVFPLLVEEKEYHELLLTSKDDAPTWTSKKTGKQYRVINGGVPQYANLTLHLDTLIQTIDDFIPPVDYAWNLVLDFESWTPIWDENKFGSANFHGRVYQEYSIDRLSQRHTSWSSKKVAKEAERLFQQHAVTFFTETLHTLRSLRPKASIGYYGYPQGYYGQCNPNDTRCGYDNPISGPKLQKQNDAIAPIYQASSALFPSVYLWPQGHNDESFAQWRLYNQKKVNDTVHEAVRLVTTYTNHNPTVPIRPFYWAYYHNGSTLLLPEDVTMIAQYSYLPPWSTEVVQWGAFNQRSEIGHWQRTVGGPRMKQAVEEMDRCSHVFCSDHGWCSKYYPSLLQEDHRVKCVCDEAHQGPSCGKTVE